MILYSICREGLFEHETLCEALEEYEKKTGKEPGIGLTYLEADDAPLSHDFVISERSILSLLESFDEFVRTEIDDESSGLYADVGDDAIEKLRKLVINWANDHVKLHNYRVIVSGPREKKVTEEDVAKYLRHKS